MTEELARAVRCESAVAIQHWFGVGEHAVWNWRRALGVSQWRTEGSRRLHQRLSEKGAAVIRFSEFSDAEREQRREQALLLNPARHIVPPRGGEPVWTA
jgi:hypothetical protein